MITIEKQQIDIEDFDNLRSGKITKITDNCVSIYRENDTWKVSFKAKRGSFKRRFKTFEQAREEFEIRVTYESNLKNVEF